MRTRTTAPRLAAAALATALAGLGTTAIAARAASTDGVGASTVSTSVIDATLGDLLGLTLLQDVAGSTTDPKIGPVGATATFRQLKLTSLVPALNRVDGEHTVSAPQGTPEVNAPTLNLSALGVSGAVSGTVDPLVLKALSTTSSSTTSTAKMTDVGVLGGLANLGIVDATDTTRSAGPAAETGRSMDLNALTLLDLGRLLQGLGLNVLDLGLSVVSGLVASTGVPVDLKGAGSLTALVTSFIQAITALSDSLGATVDAGIVTALQATGLPVDFQPAPGTVLDGPAGAIATTQAKLTTLIEGVVNLLEGVQLLKITALGIDTVAKAAATVAGSTATATGTLGSLQVGSTNLGGLDLSATPAATSELVARAQAALTDLLKPLGFTDVLSLKLFDRQAGVTETGGVVKAASSITGLVAKLTPPSIDGLVEPPDPFGSYLPIPVQNGLAPRGKAAAASAHFAAAVAPNPLDGVLGTALAGAPLLSKGMELRVGTVQSQSLHSVPAAAVVPEAPKTPETPEVPEAPAPAPAAVPTPAVATTPAGSLPRTGGEQTRLALVAMGLGALALGARRLRRTARP